MIENKPRYRDENPLHNTNFDGFKKIGDSTFFDFWVGADCNEQQVDDIISLKVPSKRPNWEHAYLVSSREVYKIERERVNPVQRDNEISTYRKTLKSLQRDNKPYSEPHTCKQHNLNCECSQSRGINGLREVEQQTSADNDEENDDEPLEQVMPPRKFNYVVLATFGLSVVLFVATSRLFG
ncbi:MAG: hypothetical protein [Siphoviridae sp. ctjeG17]|nr:MAG: hypothetical protein [Siphoviridae sp. ctjeG17]